MRFSSAWLVSSAAPIDGNATLAIARLMLATPAPRISTVKIAPPLGGRSPMVGRSRWGGTGSLAAPATLIACLLASRARPPPWSAGAVGASSALDEGGVTRLGLKQHEHRSRVSLTREI